MKRYFTGLLKSCLSLFFVFACVAQTFAQTDSVYESSRPKVGLVLSGGGAKGVAHVGVIKVLEEAGIPIDYIVGTSMGSIVGAMYAYGYSTNQLDSLFRSQDWMKLLLNSTDRDKKDFLSREFEERYILTVPFMRDKSKHLVGGVLSGEAVLDLFYALMPEHADSMDFNNLKIPYACVTFDVLHNKEIEVHSGILPECIRASMSIPAVFSPLRKDGMVLIDGGMANNYPADVAKRMGADIIIGVTLEAEGEDKTADDINSTVDVVSLLLSNATDNKIADNKAITDILINVDTKGYSSASFSTSAVNVLIDRGEKFARMAMPDLLDLKEELMLADAGATANSDIVVPREAGQIAGYTKPDDYGCTLGAGLRVDDEELASVLLGANYKFNARIQPAIGGELRLGKRSYGRLVSSVQPFKKFSIEGSYKFSYNENRMYSKGERVIDWDYHEHFARLSLFRTWNFMKFTVAADWSLRKFDHRMVSPFFMTGMRHDLTVMNYDKEKNINYYMSARFDNRDSHVYAHTGSLWTLRYTFKTDDGRKYEDERGLSVMEAFYEHNCPLGERFTFVPSVWGRFISTPDFYRLGDRNMIGGIGTWGHYLPQQIPFVGINHFEVVDDKVAAAGATLRYRLGANHHFSAIGNYGRASRYVEDLFREDELVGCGLGYGYKTPVGPIDLNVNWSNVTDKIGFWLNFGYMF